jgi:arylsulfatase A-like enzyme
MWGWILACRSPAEPLTAPVEPTPFGALAFDGAPPTNLIVLSLDTTRRDHLGAFGGVVTTPLLDARLEGGLRLLDHRSCSNWTAPSMACATTGRSPWELGFWPGTSDDEVPGFPRAIPSLARVLGQAGYDTRLVTGNAVFSSALAADGFRRETVRDYGGAKELTELALAEAEELGDGPFYLHVHYMDPHQPFCPPEEVAPAPGSFPDVGVDPCDGLQDAIAEWDSHDDTWRAAVLEGADAFYRAELGWFDLQLDTLWEGLDGAGLLDDALVVFHTDHGEQLMERGVLDHGFELHAEENRAAAAFWARTLVPGTVETPTSHEDLGATTFAVLGHAPAVPPSGFVVGSAPEGRVRRLFAYSRYDHGAPQLGIVRGGTVALADWGGAPGAWDTGADPAELLPPRPPDDDVAAELSRFAEELRATWPHLGGPGF